MARPKKPIDAKKVERLARYGSPASEIGAILNVHERTIERRFAPAIKTGHEKLCYLLRSTLVKRAIAGDNACLIFASKCIAGMKEPRDDAVNVQVNTIAANNVFAVTDAAKKHFAEIDQLVRREAALQMNQPNNGNGELNH